MAIPRRTRYINHFLHLCHCNFFLLFCVHISLAFDIWCSHFDYLYLFYITRQVYDGIGTYMRNISIVTVKQFFFTDTFAMTINDSMVLYMESNMSTICPSIKHIYPYYFFVVLLCSGFFYLLVSHALKTLI